MLLNPHLREDVLGKTQGIVLIDELDLHLHPEWQKRIVSVLRTTFPSIQFIATTHSPFLIQESEYIIRLKDNAIEKIFDKGSLSLSLEDIAEEVQGVENPQWSRKRIKMFEKAREYYKAVKEGNATDEMKRELDMVMEPFSLDTGLYAVLEQERIKEEYKRNKNK